LEAFADTATQAMTTNDDTTSFKLLFKAFSQVTQTRKVMDYDSISNVGRSLQSELEGYEAQITQIDEYITTAEAELKATSLLQCTDAAIHSEMHIRSIFHIGVTSVVESSALVWDRSMQMHI
jgi:hypothetical protein